MCQPGSNKPADTPSGAGSSQAQVHMEDDNLFDLKPNVPVSMTNMTNMDTNLLKCYHILYIISLYFIICLLS